jgi:hypothetical protein
MKDITVNGHSLPLSLIRMIDMESWCSSNHLADISNIPIEDKDDLTFLDTPEMVQNTQELQAAVDRGDGALFALTDSKKDETPINGFLDVAQAVIIAVTYGQEALALDYSVGDQPRIVATQYMSEGVIWIQVASNFNELLKILKL